MTIKLFILKIVFDQKLEKRQKNQVLLDEKNKLRVKLTVDQQVLKFFTF